MIQFLWNVATLGGLLSAGDIWGLLVALATVIAYRIYHDSGNTEE